MSKRPDYLEWPEGWPRTPENRRERNWHFNRNLTISRAKNDVLLELNRLGATHVRLSVDCPIRGDGDFYAGGPKPKDPGCALYFQLRGKPTTMACDTYDLLEQNLRAVALTIEALRAIDRHGASGFLERALSGFQALPPGTGEGTAARPWWEVLGLPQIDGVRFEEVATDPNHPFRRPLLAMAESVYKLEVPKAHPDRGGDPLRMSELSAAIRECREALGSVGS